MLSQKMIDINALSHLNHPEFSSFGGTYLREEKKLINMREKERTVGTQVFFPNKANQP